MVFAVGFSIKLLNMFISEFLLWLRGLRTEYSLFEDEGWIPGLVQGVKDPVQLQVAVQFAAVAWV